MSKINGFFAYPANPPIIGETIELAVDEARNYLNEFTFKTWRELDIAGHFISEQVLDSIDYSDFLVADISILNFNVTYEIGFAIGRQKRILLVKNSSICKSLPTIQEVGIFDTLGYKDYQNSRELFEILKSISDINPLPIMRGELNQKAPVYIRHYRKLKRIN